MSIFKQYDIRGEYPKEINEEIIYKIGRLIPRLLKSKNAVIGYDIRQSSKPLFRSLINGLSDENTKVISIGNCTTPMLYFASFNYDFDLAIMITASHLDKNSNGLKICSKNGVSLGYDEIGKYLEENINKEFKKTNKKFNVKNLNIFKDYSNFILNNFKKTKLKIIVDSGNMMGYLDVRILKKIANIKTLFNKPDGSMPNHLANPAEEKTLKIIKKEIKNNNYNLGIAFDGDCDRAGFLDEKGNIIRADTIAVFIYEYLYKNLKIIADHRCSKALLEIGNNIIRSPVGHSNIKKNMLKHDAEFGMELSGHYYFKKFHYLDNALLAVLLIIQILNKENKKISELIEPFQKYFPSEETNFKVKDKDKAVWKVINSFKNYKKIEKIDGISLYFKDFWFNIRKSNTEDLLRLTIEADSKEKLKEITKIIKNLIKNL